MAECKVMHCNCSNESQDALYGKGMRLWNPAGKGSDQGSKYRCTSCGANNGGATVKRR